MGLIRFIQQVSLKNACKSNDRTVIALNFASAKTIAILSNPKSKKEIEEIEAIEKLLLTYKKQVFPLIFFDKLIEKDIFTNKTGWGVLTKSACNWFGKPKKDQNLQKFTETEFDILVDMTNSPSFGLQYVFVQSRARLKVMPTSEFSKLYADLMIQIDSSKSKYMFVQEVIKYLEIINKV